MGNIFMREKFRRKFILAVFRRDHKRVQKLIWYAAKGDKEEALRLAARWGHLEMVRYFVERCDTGVDVTDACQDSALLEAAIWGHGDIVQYLADRCDADVNAKDGVGPTALMAAASNDRTGVVRYLVEQCAVTVSANALTTGASRGSLNVVRYFVEQCGVDVNMKDEHGQTAMMAAIAAQEIDVRRYLEEQRSVNETAAQLAANDRYWDILRMLMPFIHFDAVDTTKDGVVLSSDIPSSSSIPPSEIELTLFHENGNVGGDFQAKWLDADVAVTLFIPDAIFTSFEDEVRLWQQLRHPNVLKMYGVCEAAAHLKFLVCEYAGNGSLLEHVNSTAVEKATMWKYLYEAALGLEYLHERGIVHAELRCSNILIDFTQMVKISPEQARVMRLSSTRATTNSLYAFQWRIQSLMTSLGKTEKVETETETRWQQQRNEQIEQFISGVSDTFLLLNALKTVEERSAFLKTLKEEIKTTGKYSHEQHEVMEKMYDDLASKLEGDDWSELAPVWFIPWYELVIDEWNKLGEGSFGSVHRAKWLDSDVVVKRVILPGSDSPSDDTFSIYSSLYASEDPSATQIQEDTAKRAEARAMFRREVDIWFGFSHPHVVRLFGACHVGSPFFVCEYATNGTLVSYLGKNPDELWSKLHEAALGVQYIHARGVVHGDLKGNNIVIGSDMKAKVTDFGLSSVGDSEEETLVSVRGAESEAKGTSG
ncbi:hypothetical protein PR001_g14896 [Phytophthora rubi]|uniref:Protein kinase domain-containing protein n=1 Tax=Phytophthora rubi TaxID=129364 RepID=A0A6A3LBR1_9STRA|nr:hypothetical protein PR001_g14896 [Phytophthora rubi]